MTFVWKVHDLSNAAFKVTLTKVFVIAGLVKTDHDSTHGVTTTGWVF